MTFVNVQVAQNQTMKAYWVPAAVEDPQSAPGIVLVQEIFGINNAMRLKAQEWAQRGFNVLCPDLFWRQEAGLSLEPRIEEEFQKGVSLMGAMVLDETLADLEATRAHLAQQIGHERIAAVGYCMGGRLVVQMAGQAKIRCAVSYYGVSLETVLPELPANAVASLLHIAELDSFVPEDARAVIIKEVEAREGWAYELYEGCDHAFARPSGAHYVEEAAAKAEVLSLDFMHQHLAS